MVRQLKPRGTLYSREEHLVALRMYLGIPFRKINMRNNEVIRVAGLIGRTPGSLARKMLNFSSLDPAITSTGRSGLRNCRSDRELWKELLEDGKPFTDEMERAWDNIHEGEVSTLDEAETSDESITDDHTGETREAVTNVRVGQGIFRTRVLLDYGVTCCISGISNPEFLQAAHVIPWSKNKQNRLNPENGLCMSMFHHKAYDMGNIAVDPESMTLIISPGFKMKDDVTKAMFKPFAGKKIAMPDKFCPQPKFLAWHKKNVFRHRKKV